MAASLGACRPAAHGTRLVLGDQTHVLQAKMEAAGALGSLDYAIEWANFPGAAPLFEALNAGAVDTAPAADLPIISAAVGGCRLRIPAISRSRSDSFGIVVPAHSPLVKVADLAGRTVIVSSARGSITHYLLLEALREAGLKPDAVTIGFMLPNDAASTYDAGKFDAWVTFGVYLVRAELAGGHVLRDARGICPGYGGIAVAQSALDDPARHRALGDFLRRARRANQWARANIEAYARVYSKLTGAALPIARKVVERENPALYPPDAAFVADVQRATDRFVAYGVFPHGVDVAALVETRLLAAEQEPGSDRFCRIRRSSSFPDASRGCAPLTLTRSDGGSGGGMSDRG